MSRSKSSLIYFPPSLVLKRDDGDIGFVFLLLRELHGAVYEGVESVVLTHSDVLVRIVDGAPLPYDDVMPLCLTMMLPAFTTSPPNFLSPSLLEWDSRPFFELDCPFLCAIIVTL